MPTDIQLSVEYGAAVLKDIISGGYSFWIKVRQRKNLFEKYSLRYVQELIERFGEVKVLGMDKPVPLLSLYVRVNILEKINARAGSKVEDLEKFFDFDRRAFGNKVETKDGEEIANDLQRFIVLGKPGTGKTTFLKYLALAMVYEKSVIQNRRLPIFVTLRDWADRNTGLMEYIIEQFHICGFGQPEHFVKNVLRQGKCLVLFDGLDEISQETKLDDIIRQIRDFTNKYSRNQFVISCRIATYNNWFERFTDVEMADFDKKQIETFVQNWFSNETNKAEECLKGLQLSPQLIELSSVPLLLTLLCISYNANNDFPNNRADLYEEAINILLRQWDSERRIRRKGPDLYEQLSLEQKMNMFARIAFGTFKENRYFIRERDLNKMIENFISNEISIKTKSPGAEYTDILQAIEAQHGIFVERAKHIHSFAHLTFQEYFTAKYIVNDALNGALESLVQDHLHNKKWDEVFLLVSGMLPDADELLIRMLKKNRGLLEEPALNALLGIAEKMLLPGSKYPPEIRKAMVIFRILALVRGLDLNVDPSHDPALDLARDLARDLTRAVARTLVRDLARARGLDLDLDPALDLDRAFTRGLDLDLDPALDRTLDIVLALDRGLNLDLDLDLDLANNLANDIASDLEERNTSEIGAL